jgi:hypothetical protein
MMRPVQQLVQQWRHSGVELNPGASPADLEALRALLHCDIPKEIRDFYLSANGMPPNVYDDHQVSFWSIDAMRKQRDLWGDAELGFADFLIDSWRFIFRVDRNRVIVVSENVAAGEPAENLGSFRDFLGLYLGNPEALRIL